MSELKLKKVRCLLLLSGGLDSTLAAKLLLGQGIEVALINFATSFCGPGKARQAAGWLGLPLREVNIKEEFILVLKKPKHGYGAGMNPCIDCHALMLKKAGQIMQEEGFDFVATGEVLNERPMSQTKQSLKIVEKEAGLEGYLLRPLSAKALAPTEPEKDGRVDRQKLLGIAGRSRKIQMALAAQSGLKDYPTPAGGCALTQAGFASRVKDLFKHQPACQLADVELLKVGRHFWIDGAHIVIGRNEADNLRLEKLAQLGDVLLIPEKIPGPTAVVRAKNISQAILEKTAKLMAGYIKKSVGLENLSLISRQNGQKKQVEFRLT